MRDVLGHGEVGKKLGILVDGGDAVIARLDRVAKAHALAGEDDLALVGLLQSGDDLDERRLARAVLADQTVHGAGVDVETDLFERAHRAKRLADAPQVHDGFARRLR